MWPEKTPGVFNFTGNKKWGKNPLYIKYEKIYDVDIIIAI